MKKGDIFSRAGGVFIVIAATVCASAENIPSVSDLLDKYTQALDSTANFAEHYEKTTDFAYRVKGAKDKGRAFVRGQVRYDGKLIPEKRDSKEASPMVPKEEIVADINDGLFSEHFVGVYAFEATPYWPEFEIVRDGNAMVLQSSDSGWKLNVVASDGILTAKEDDGGELKLSYDSSKDCFVMSMQIRVATRTGTKKIPETRMMVKVKSSPNNRLESEYGITAAQLVDRVRDSEDWIHQVKSFLVKAKDKWTKTPRGIEYRKKELKEQFPDMEINSDRFPELRLESEGEFHLCYDNERFRIYKHMKDDSLFLHIWNGREFIAHENYFKNDREIYAFRKDIPEFNNVLVDLMWPRSKQHPFWWQKKQMNDWEDFYGRAQDFILVGRQDYRGVSCYVLECRPKSYRRVRRWFVGTEDRLKYGDLTYEQGQLTWEQWTQNYSEIKPCWWFPMTQGYHLFSRDESGTSFIASTRNITIEEIQVDGALPNELFVIEFKDDVDVNDDRFGGFVTYKYKKNRSEEEWKEIHQQAQKRKEDDDAEKRLLDERIGQPAPDFPAECKWLNTEPLTIEKIRGKAAVLQFWAVSCGPCHGYMDMLRKKPEGEKIIVIGIHIPEKDLDKIKTDMDKYKADGPVFVDAGQGWGRLNDWYHVRRRPYWIVIDPDGKVAGHADNPYPVLKQAQMLVETAPKTK